MPARNKMLLLLHPAFLSCLFILIANDHWWKYAYSNWLTGKLSDFAGVFVLAVFLIAITPLRKSLLLIVAALFFAWWKSPLSEPFLQFFYNQVGVRLVRVIDYSDLAALPVLIFAYYVKPYPYNIHPRVYQWSNFSIAVVCVLSMMATSLPLSRDYQYPPGRVWVNKTFRTKLTAEAFLKKLDSLQIPWQKQPFDDLPVNPDHYYLKVQSETDTIEKWIPLANMQDTGLYYRKSLTNTYLIPQLVLEKDTITNLQFQVSDQGRKRSIEVVSMHLPDGFDYTYYYSNRKLRKKYLAIFRSLFIESK